MGTGAPSPDSDPPVPLLTRYFGLETKASRHPHGSPAQGATSQPVRAREADDREEEEDAEEDGPPEANAGPKAQSAGNSPGDGSLPDLQPVTASSHGSTNLYGLGSLSTGCAEVPVIRLTLSSQHLT